MRWGQCSGLPVVLAALLTAATPGAGRAEPSPGLNRFGAVSSADTRLPGFPAIAATEAGALRMSLEYP